MLNMRPVLAAHNSFDCGFRNAESTPQCFIGKASLATRLIPVLRIKSADLLHISFCEARHRMGRTSGSHAAFGAAFLVAIFVVFFCLAQEQMARSDAQRVVASVADHHARWNWTEAKCPREAICKYFSPLRVIDVKNCAPTPVLTSWFPTGLPFPIPASRPFFDLGPEAPFWSANDKMIRAHAMARVAEMNHTEPPRNLSVTETVRKSFRLPLLSESFCANPLPATRGLPNSRPEVIDAELGHCHGGRV
jgi:hypothetical protein